MPRIPEDRADRRDLHETTGVHDRQPIDELRQQPHIVADKNHRSPELLLHRPEGLHHLPLHDHVERARRLVGDDHLRLEADPERDADTLLHPPAEFVRIKLAHILAQIDHVQQLAHPLADPAVVHIRLMRLDAVDEVLADPAHRVERVHRPLRDQGNFRQPHPAHLLERELGEVAVPEQDRPARDPPRRADQAHDGECGGGLPAPRLPGQAEAFPLAQREGDAIDRLDHALGRLIMHAEIANPENIGPDCGRGAHEFVLRTRGFATSSRPLLISIRPTNSSTNSTIGVSHHHHRPRIRALKAIDQ